MRVVRNFRLSIVDAECSYTFVCILLRSVLILVVFAVVVVVVSIISVTVFIDLFIL